MWPYCVYMETVCFKSLSPIHDLYQGYQTHPMPWATYRQQCSSWAWIHWARGCGGSGGSSNGQAVTVAGLVMKELVGQVAIGKAAACHSGVNTNGRGGEKRKGTGKYLQGE